MTPKFTPACAVDFDETLHPYTRGRQGPEPDDEPPTCGAKEALAAMKARGWDVIIFSVRSRRSPGGEEAIRNWLTRYKPDEDVDRITHEKPHAFAYVDDRAVPYTGNWLAVMKGVEALSKRPKKTQEYHE